MWESTVLPNIQRAETVNNESSWVTNSFTKPLNQLIKEFVPVKNATGKLEIRDLTKSTKIIYSFKKSK